MSKVRHANTAFDRLYRTGAPVTRELFMYLRKKIAPPAMRAAGAASEPAHFEHSPSKSSESSWTQVVSAESCSAFSKGQPLTPTNVELDGADVEESPSIVSAISHLEKLVQDDEKQDDGSSSMFETSDSGSSESEDQAFVVTHSIASRSKSGRKERDERRFENKLSQKIHAGRIGEVEKLRCGRRIKSDRYKQIRETGVKESLRCSQCFGVMEPETSQESDSD